MLFHIKQVHTPENCPSGEGGSRSLRDESVAGVDLKAAYGAFMEHTVYMVVETTPSRSSTISCTITPVSA